MELTCPLSAWPLPRCGPGPSLLQYWGFVGRSICFLGPGPHFLVCALVLGMCAPWAFSDKAFPSNLLWDWWFGWRQCPGWWIISFTSVLPASGSGELNNLNRPASSCSACHMFMWVFFFVSLWKLVESSPSSPHAACPQCALGRSVFSRIRLDSQWALSCLPFLVNFLEGYHWWFLPLWFLSSFSVKLSFVLHWNWSSYFLAYIFFLFVFSFYFFFQPFCQHFESQVFNF